jgi:hypothetical protein
MRLHVSSSPAMHTISLSDCLICRCRYRISAQFVQQYAQCAGQLVIGIFQDPGQGHFDVTASLRHRDTAL